MALKYMNTHAAGDFVGSPAPPPTVVWTFLHKNVEIKKKKSDSILINPKS